ncbi:Putative ribonuclease H protein At1g65750 [Linum perenne]
MERAWDRGIRKLEIQTDSLCVVTILSQMVNPDHYHATIVAGYKRLLERNWTIILKHIFREANHLANSIASKGHQVSLEYHTVDCRDDTIRYWERYDSIRGTETHRILM